MADSMPVMVADAVHMPRRLVLRSFETWNELRKRQRNLDLAGQSVVRLEFTT